MSTSVRNPAPGSIRTDVILRGDNNEILAIYDVKTGGAVLRPSRANELRAKTGAGPEVPVIELHFERGVSVKHEQGEKYSGSDSEEISWDISLQELSGRAAGRKHFSVVYDRRKS